MRAAVGRAIRPVRVFDSRFAQDWNRSTIQPCRSSNSELRGYFQERRIASGGVPPFSRKPRFAEALPRAAMASSASISRVVSPESKNTNQSEVDRLRNIVLNLPDGLQRYTFLMSMLHYDKNLFLATLRSDLPELLPLIYTPLVGDACKSYSVLNVPPRGLRIGINQAGSIRKIFQDYPEKNISVIVVTDGERILGLGDLGANGHGIPVGKLLIYSAAGGIPPEKCLPITLDVGCNTSAVRDDPHYIGLKQSRVRGDEYLKFLDEFTTAVVDCYGSHCLLQFEDFAKSTALTLLERYRHKMCTFNDDIQGTAAVALAGLLSALRIPGVNTHLIDHRFLFLGAGSAGIGIASLIVLELVRLGVPEDVARKCCWFVDSNGLIYRDRNDSISEAKAPFAHDVDEDLRKASSEGFEAIVQRLKPTGLIGVSTSKGAFTATVLRSMASFNAKPIVFALSNPLTKAECTAEEAYIHTNGSAIFASGSPFQPVTLRDGSVRVPGQGNNAFMFPGIGLGVVAAEAREVTDDMLLVAAKTLAELVPEKHLQQGCVYPHVEDLLDISTNVALAVAKEAVSSGLTNIKHVGMEQIKKLTC